MGGEKGGREWESRSGVDGYNHPSAPTSILYGLHKHEGLVIQLWQAEITNPSQPEEMLLMALVIIAETPDA
jgi:hypothetical protein